MHIDLPSSLSYPYIPVQANLHLLSSGIKDCLSTRCALLACNSGTGRVSLICGWHGELLTCRVGHVGLSRQTRFIDPFGRYNVRTTSPRRVKRKLTFDDVVHWRSDLWGWYPSTIRQLTRYYEAPVAAMRTELETYVRISVEEMVVP